MKLVAFEAVAKALDAEQARYLVAGGLAVNAHGYIRLTMDIDLVIALDSENIQRALRALSELDYRPTVPIELEDFSKPGKRAQWRREKGMQVLNFHSDRFPGTAVDIFVYEPFDFDTEYHAALIGELMPGLPVRFVSVSMLIEMKEAAGRPRDLDDVQHLKWIQEDSDHE